jgi:signal transduction histidine kinase
LATATSQSLIGKSFFGDYSQQFIKHNKVLTEFVRNLLSGTPGYAIYNYGDGEKLTTGYPIFADDKPVYFIRLITPTAGIYSHINDVLFNERLKMFSLIAGTTAAIAILIVFLIKWSSLNDKVKKSAKELSESNKQLKLANEQLKVHDKIQNEFINVAAHELRTPIQPILGLTAVLHSRKNNMDKEEQWKLLDVIRRNANRLQRLTEDILDVTKIESQSLKLNKEQFDLNEVVSNTIADYKNELKEGNSNIKLELVFKGDEGAAAAVLVEADKARLSQVIANILGNAIKFTKEGCISIVQEVIGSSQILISIKDTGSGIDPEIMPRLFTKFATKSQKGGTGLGLFISKGIIEDHNGRIWAENNTQEKGATFHFSLPISKKSVHNNNHRAAR